MDEIEILKTKRFDSENQFKEFENKLEGLIYSEKLMTIDSEVISNVRFIIYIYAEKNIYCLSEPDLYWRGFFLDYDSTISYLKNLEKADKRKRNGCFITILIIILVTLILIIIN